jgi:hypothetical protein
MPLVQGFSPESVQANIAELIRAGHAPAQSAAIAYKTARAAFQRRHPRAPLPSHLRRNPADLDEFVLAQRAKIRRNFGPSGGGKKSPDPEIDMEEWATTSPEDRYYEAHWGENPTRVHKFPDPEVDPHIPAMLTEMGKLEELRIVLGEDSRGKEKIGTIKIPSSPRALVAFSNDDAERVYLMLPHETKARMAERLFLPGTETYRLQEAADAAGGRQCEWRFPPLHVQVLGYCSHIVYRTTKRGDGPSGYIHEWGEETGIRPLLCVDHKGRLWLAGGDYRVMPGGIAN